MGRVVVTQRLIVARKCACVCVRDLGYNTRVWRIRLEVLVERAYVNMGYRHEIHRKFYGRWREHKEYRALKKGTHVWLRLIEPPSGGNTISHRYYIMSEFNLVA